MRGGPLGSTTGKLIPVNGDKFVAKKLSGRQG
jgi:hypothetical protein